MAYERLWPSAQQNFTANGTTNGQIQVADSAGFFVGAYATLYSNTQQPTTVQINQIITETAPIFTICVGPYYNEAQKDLRQRVNVSNFLVSDGAYILQPQQQYGFIKPEYIANAVYERDSVKAIRVEPVDNHGNPISASNPLPVTGTFTPGGGTIPSTWYDIKLTYDSNNNLTVVQYYSAPLVVERTLTLTYDSNNNLIDVFPS